MQPAPTIPTMHPVPSQHAAAWKSGMSLDSLLEVSWKNGLRWGVVITLLLFGLGFVSSGVRNFGEYRSMRLQCQKGQIPLPSYDDVVTGKVQADFPSASCLRKDPAGAKVTLDCSCYSGVEWASACAFTALGVMLLLFIMVAMTDKCCCCFTDVPRAHSMMNAPNAVVVGVPAGMASMQGGYPYPGQGPPGTAINMYPMNGVIQMNAFPGSQYAYSTNTNARGDLIMSVPASGPAWDRPQSDDVTAIIGLPTSGEPPKSTLPYRTVSGI